MIWIVLVVSLFLSLSSGAAVGASLGLTGFIILQLFANGSADLAMNAVFNTLTSFSLSAIPIFLLLGEVMTESGTSKRIYRAVAPRFERIPGRLLHSNIVVCTLFGAISGSSTATAAAVSSVSYKELSRMGYSQDHVIGSLAGGGTIGLLIPPSLALLIYGAWQGVSIGKLFLAGILPGLLVAGLFMIYIFYIGVRNPDIAPGISEEDKSDKSWSEFFQIWPLIVLIGSVLGSIYLGFATPTEAAGLGVTVAILMGFALGELSFSGLVRACMRTAEMFGTMAFVLIGAIVLGQAIAILALPKDIILFVSSFDLGSIQFLVALMFIYIILGCFFDGISLMLLTLPFVFPVVLELGIDPVWFGVFVTLMIEVGLITPPVGMNLYVLAAVTGRELSLQRIAKSALPYWFLLIVATILLMIFPNIALFIPELIR